MELEEADRALSLLSNGIRRLKMEVDDVQEKLDEIVRADEEVGFCAALLAVIDERNTALARVVDLEADLVEERRQSKITHDMVAALNDKYPDQREEVDYATARDMAENDEL